MANAVAARRLTAQRIGGRALSTPSEVVAWLGAVQAQDYAAAKWAIGLRLASDDATDASIERAVSDGAIIRTHAFRGTWQFVTPADIHWILALAAPRVVAGSASRYRELGLGPTVVRRSNATLEKALSDGDHLTRAELTAALDKAGISTAGQRLAHLLGQAEIDGLICSGARRGRQSTYALLDHRAPNPGLRLHRDELIAKLAERYFRSRGPATIHDFSWWSGLTIAETRVGLEAVKSTLVSEVVDGATYWRLADGRRAGPASPLGHLLPAFDEYLVAYRNRDDVLDPKHVARLNAGGGMLNPTVVVDGRVIGTWRRTLARAMVTMDLHLFKAPTPNERRAIGAAAKRYGAFLGLEASVAVTSRRGK